MPDAAAAAETSPASVEGGGLLYCSAVWPVDASGSVVEGGLLAQAEQVYKYAETVLQDAGYTTTDVIRTVEFIDVSALPEYRETWRVRAAHLGPPGGVNAAATGIPMSTLALPGALLQVEFTACRGTKRRLDPGWKRYERLTYAPGVWAGEYVFLSGFVATDLETGELQAPGDVAGQARCVYESIRHVLRVAALELDAITKVTEYLTPEGLTSHAEVAAVRGELFGEAPPAYTSVPCATLLRPGALIEIDCVAAAPNLR
jgi:enamine deaminase RidA (YjgF/YER057c/UK114 family)